MQVIIGNKVLKGKDLPKLANKIIACPVPKKFRSIAIIATDEEEDVFRAAATPEEFPFVLNEIWNFLNIHINPQMI